MIASPKVEVLIEEFTNYLNKYPELKSFNVTHTTIGPPIDPLDNDSGKWCKGTPYPPDCAVVLMFDLDGPRDMMRILTAHLMSHGIVAQLQIHKRVVKDHKVIKKPFFDQVFKTMREHHPKLREEDLIYDRYADWGTDEVNTMFVDRIHEYQEVEDHNFFQVPV